METVMETKQEHFSKPKRCRNKVVKITINRKCIFVEKKVKQPKVAKVKPVKVVVFTPTKQEIRIKELEIVLAAINKEMEEITNESDKKLYKTMLKEVKNSIFQLKNQ